MINKFFNTLSKLIGVEELTEEQKQANAAASKAALEARGGTPIPLPTEEECSEFLGKAAVVGGVAAGVAVVGAVAAVGAVGACMPKESTYIRQHGAGRWCGHA